MSSGPGLLDIVPWSHGYAHSWALRWLITNPPTRTAVLDLLTGRDGGPWELSRDVAREHPVKRARADLAAWATDRSGAAVQIAVEVKVNDPINERQLAAYQADGFEPVLYVPGLTGLMMAPNGPVVGERWIIGLDLANALAGVQLTGMIGSYIDAVRDEGRRMELARAFARGEAADFPQDGQADYDAVKNSGWVIEIALAMMRLGATDIWIRPQRNDRGLYWSDSRRTLAGGELYIDVVADIRRHDRWIAIKLTGSDQATRLAVYQQAIEAGPPPGEGWTRAPRPSRVSGRAWSLKASGFDVEDAAARTLSAGAWIAQVAGS